MKNLMQYKGYSAKVEYSDDDKCFFGVVLGLADSVSFEGQSIEELNSAFVEAVDDYLEMCQRIGKKPEKAYKGSFNVRINPQLHKQAAISAMSAHISLNQLVEKAVKSYVKAK